MEALPWCIVLGDYAGDSMHDDGLPSPCDNLRRTVVQCALQQKVDVLSVWDVVSHVSLSV